MNVVYVLDGENVCVNLVAVHRAFIQDMEDEIPFFLIVGITSENTRRNDFMVGEGKGETKRVQKFLNFMSDELSPCIESRYHVIRYRVGIGHSLGSSLLMYALCERDSFFNTYMMFSPNLVYGQDRLLKSFKTKVPVKPDKFVYISSGETGDLEAGYKKGSVDFILCL